MNNGCCIVQEDLLKLLDNLTARVIVKGGCQLMEQRVILLIFITAVICAGI